VAATRTAARIAAQARLGVIAPGDEARVLAGVELSALQWPPDVAAALGRWGVRTLGELASLPRPALAARLGLAGLAAHDVSRGIDETPWSPWTPPPYWEEAQELDWEIDALGPLMAVLGRSAPPTVRGLATVWARLVALVGAERVGAVALADSHHPDAFVPIPLDVDAPAGADPMPADGPAVLALRRLRPPRRVRVVTDGEGRPAAVHGALTPEARVLGCAGPWRVAGEWWDEGAWARDGGDAAV